MSIMSMITALWPSQPRASLRLLTLLLAPCPNPATGIAMPMDRQLGDQLQNMLRKGGAGRGGWVEVE